MAYGLIGGLSRVARNAAASKRRELPADMPMAEELIPPPMPTSMASGMQRMGGGIIGGGAPRLPTQPMTPMQAPAPVVQGGQTRTREQASQAGLIGRSAPKKQSGLFEMFGYDGEGTGMQPLDWLFSSREDVEAARERKAGADRQQRFESALDQLQLSPQDRVRAEMDPEGFFRGMNEANTANMKPQTETFWDPVNKQWMRKPLGPMAVAEGTDLVDPETQAALYTNDKAPEPAKPANWQTQTVGNRVIAYNPQNPKETMDMGPAPAGSSGRDVYRLASPQEVQAAGLPPGTVMKVNTVTNEPTILRNPSQTKEYDPVQIRQFKKSVSGLDLLNTTMDSYEATLKQYGGPQGIKGPWNVEHANAIEAARNNVLVLAKELYELGALVGADFSIIEAAIKPATGFESTGQTNETIAASLGQVRSMLQNKMSQIPEDFILDVRKSYTGDMARKFNPGTEQPQSPQASQPSWLAKQGQRVMQQAGGQPTQPRQPTAQFNVPPEAVQELMADPSPEAMAEFDDAFGPGAAEAILNGSR